MDSFELAGHWKLPYDPGTTYFGTLRYEPDGGASLRLTFPSAAFTTFAEDTHEYEVIHGVSDKGELISLCNAFDNGGSWARGMQVKSILANIVFKGLHLPSFATSPLVAMSATFPLLHSWFRRSGFNFRRHKGYGFTLSYKTPKRLAVTCNDGTRITFHENLESIPWMPEFNGRFDVTEMTYVQIHGKKPKPFRYYEDILFALQDFFSIACGTSCQSQSIFVVGAFNPEKLAGRKKLHYPSASVYLPRHHNSNEKEVLHPAELLFRYQDIKPNFHAVIQTWIDEHERSKPIRALYTSALYGPRRYIETSFIALAQAAEVFHRRYRHGQYMTKALFRKTVLKPLRDALPDGLDAETETAFSNKLAYLNEYSLANRLNALYDEHNALLGPLIPDRHGLIGNIVNARNRLTHYAKGNLSNPVDFRNLIAMSDVLRLLLDLCFLGQFGFNPETIRTLARSASTHKRLIEGITRHYGSAQSRPRGTCQ